MRAAPNSDSVTEHHYPRPQLRRSNWRALNGWWDFVIDEQAAFTDPAEVVWGSSKILVPFSPETPRSGIARTGLYKACWYRRSFQGELQPPGRQVVLNFGAVDYAATVWINGRFAGGHQGGYTPFSINITPFLIPGGEQTVVVRAYDDPADLQKPRGKQDWQLDPHSIWYPRTTGIWQTVWLEEVNSTRIGHISWIPNLVRWEFGFEAWVKGVPEQGCRIKLKLRCKDKTLAEDEYTVFSNEVHRTIALSDPGIDDFRNEMLWSPESPTLIEASLQLILQSGETVDEVESYTALRAVNVEGNRFVLNGRPYYLRLVLDQGYWSQTGLTPPGDDDIKKDIQLIKEMGFNGVRKHQKIEDPRFLYWADTLGLLVWEEMPSAYRFTQLAIERVTNEWMRVIERDISHPCIMAWVPFNESWGVPNLPEHHAQRNYVQALYYLTKTMDTSRLVIGNDGWESVTTDIIGIHDYDSNPQRIIHRYRGDRLLPHILKQERPGGRSLVLGNTPPGGESAIVLSEFGGIAYAAEGREGTWGYSRAYSREEFGRALRELMHAVHSLGILTGFCYTQLADTYQEANGLLYVDRRPKLNVKEIRDAIRGSAHRYT